MPRSAARNAAEYPPGPEPRTTMSQLRSEAPEYAAAGAVEGVGATATGAAAGAERGTGAAATGPWVSSSAMTLPWETLSPTLTRSSLMTPASDDGISIVALSDSSVIREASFATRSPGLTSTSMTSTSLKPPMSGTFTAIICATPASQEGAADVGEHRGEIRGEARAGGTVDDAVIVCE